jgi:dihydrofolate reductase
MGLVIAHVSMSLDGFVAGPDVDREQPLGRGGERLHEWLFAEPPDPEDAEIVAAMTAEIGSVVLGHRTFTVGEAHWGGATPFPVPCFVLTHTPREDLPRGPTSFTFVTDGIESALERARAAAGRGCVALMGAETIQQFLRAGLLDELQINLVPVLLGGGTRLFDLEGERVELERTRLVGSPRVMHLRFRFVRDAASTPGVFPQPPP